MRRLLVPVVAAVALVSSVVALGAVARAATPPPTKTVSISGTNCFFCFRPAALTVKAGTRVVWKNVSGATHTVTRCTKAACNGMNGGTGTDKKFASPLIGNGKTYAFVFHHKGTYRYYCKIHGYSVMHGTVTVK